jgi:hypothetical protein
MNPQIHQLLTEYENQLEVKRQIDNRAYAAMLGDRYKGEQEPTN